MLGRSHPFPCDDIHKPRTMVIIIWTSIMTISAYIWVAIHPNVPHLGDDAVKIVRRCARSMKLALVAGNYHGVWHSLCLYVPRYSYSFYWCFCWSLVSDFDAKRPSHISILLLLLITCVATLYTDGRFIVLVVAFISLGSLNPATYVLDDRLCYIPTLPLVINLYLVPP